MPANSQDEAEEDDLEAKQNTLKITVNLPVRLRSGNEELMESCRSLLGDEKIHEDDASQLIIRELWKKRRESHLLRVVK